jgi:hypothetical protein
MQIEDYAWMVRDLGERPSSLHLADGYLLVGGWDGRLTYWHLEGEMKWSVQLPDRIQEITHRDGEIYLTSGLFVIRINGDDGSVDWQVMTEGSADSIIFDSANNHIHVTSSVYDIEHGDFMESACWRIEATSGEILNVQRFSERPWHLSLQDGKSRLGLGRPRSGLLLVSANGEMEWNELGDESPVTCGVDGRSSQIYGHANGSISRWNGTTATLVATRERTIEGITCTPTGLLLGLENGLVEALDEDGGEIWSRQFDGTIISSEVGMEISSTPCAWLQYRSADGGGTVVCSASDGEGIAEFKFSCSPTAFTHSDEFAVVATENGSIFVIEAELFQRRLSTAAGVEESGDESDGQGGDSGEMNEEIDKRREMRAKLRRLRGE